MSKVRTISRSSPKPEQSPLDSEAAFRVLAETTAVPVFIHQGQDFVYVNPATEQLTGYSREELLRMRFFDVVHPDDREKVLGRGRRPQGVEAAQTPHEFRIQTKSGEERWIEYSSGVIEYKGNPAVIGMAFDITERRRAERLQEAVYRIGRAANEAERLDDLYAAIHAIIGEVMTARNFYIALYDAEKNLLSFPYFVDEVDSPPSPGPPGRGLTEYVLRTGQPLLVDAAKDEELQKRGEVALVGPPSPIWLGVPLLVGNQVIGVMALQHYSDPHAYGEREKRMLEFVSSQVAAVIHRKRAEDALRESEERYRRRADELAALYETARDLALQRDLAVLLNIVADRVIEQLRSPGCVIFLHNLEKGHLEAVVARGWDGIVGTILEPGEGLAGQVARSHQPLAVEDYSAWEGRSPKFAHMPVTALAAVPMLYSAELVGVLTVFELSGAGDVPRRRYTEADLNLLSVFAGTAASAVHNARLFEETRRRLFELEVLYQASLASAQIHSLKAVAQRVIETLEQLMDWQRGSLWIIDESRRKPVLLARSTTGLVGEALRAEMERVDALIPDMESGIIGWVCSHGKSVNCGDVKADPRYIESVPGTQSELCVPLRLAGRTIGCINVESRSPNAFSDHDERLLSTLASQTAIAIENAQLYQEALRSAERRSVLYQAAQEIARASQDPEQVYAAVHRAAAQLLPCETFVITLADEARRKIHGVYLFDDGERYPNAVQEFGEGLSGKVIAAGRPVHIRDFNSDDQGVTPHVFSRRGMTRSLIAVPMRSGDKIIGMISAQSYEPDVYTEEDVALLETLAANAGVAIENARLFEETRQRAVRQAVLNTIIMSATRAETDLDALFNVALEHTLRALRLDMGAVWFTHPLRGVPRYATRGLLSVSGSTAVQILNTVSENTLHTDVVADWGAERRPVADNVLRMGVVASIIVPMFSNGQRVGGVAVGCSQSHAWSGDEIALVEAVGREVGAAAERARLFEETRLRLAELEVVNRVSVALRRARTLDEMLPLLLDETLHAFDTSTGCIWLYDSMSGRLQQAVGRGWCLNFSHVELEAGEGIPGVVFASGDVYFSSDVSRDPIASTGDFSSLPEGWSAVCVPILAEQEAIGALFISAPRPREFDANNSRLLVTLAEIAGNAIHRTLLYEQMERHAAEMEARVRERTAELQAALQKAQEGDRLKTEFIANVNHELRTPLTNLVLYYQMLRAQPTVRTAERLDVIGRELQRLRTLIEDLLDLSRLDLGLVSLQMKPDDLNRLVQDLVNDRRPLAEERRLTLTIELAPNLPLVWMDEALLTRAISNLLTNALNYTPPGGEVRVQTWLERRRGVARVGLRVQDTGPGIDAEDLPHLFDRFYRGKLGQQSGVPGTGLGLAIVKQVMEQHGGRIEVDPGRQQPGVGAAFTLWLPVKEPQEAA